MWTDGSKMAVVERNDQVSVQAFGQYHDRSVRAAQREVAVLLYEGADPIPIIRKWRNDAHLIKSS